MSVYLSLENKNVSKHVLRLLGRLAPKISENFSIGDACMTSRQSLQILNMFAHVTQLNFDSVTIKNDTNNQFLKPSR